VNLVTDASGVQKPSVGKRRGRREIQKNRSCTPDFAGRELSRVGKEESIAPIFLANRRRDERR
jgi:hypothetical protein